MAKVHDLTVKPKEQEGTGDTIGKRSTLINSYIIKQRQGLVTPNMKKQSIEDISVNGIVKCPNEVKMFLLYLLLKVQYQLIQLQYIITFVRHILSMLMTQYVL